MYYFQLSCLSYRHLHLSLQTKEVYMKYFDRLDNFRSMEKAGYPDYVVNLRGDIVNLKTGHISYAATRSGSGLFFYIY